jgi:hypothetical protein
MNFNHLVSRINAKSRCSGEGHYWLPTGTMEATPSGDFRVDFYCKHCYNRATEFLNKKSYGMHKNTLTKYSNTGE